MLRISNIRIGVKLGIMSGLGILLVLGMIASQMMGNNAVRRSNDAANLQQQIARGVIAAKASSRGMQTAVRDIRLARSSEDLQNGFKALQEQQSETHKSMDPLIAKVQVAENRARAERIKDLVDQYAAGAKQIATIKANAIELQSKRRAGDAGGENLAAQIADLDNQAVNLARERTLPIAAEVEKLIDQMNDVASRRAQQEIETASQEMTSAERLALGIALFAAAMLVGSAIFGALSIARPLRNLVPELKKLADGDFNIHLPGLGRKDEIGLISEAAQIVADKVGATIAKIKLSAREVTNASAEISTSTTDLSQRTEEQAASLEETSASMEQITSTVKKNADNAQQANTFATGTREVADRGGEVVARAVEAMARIEESSRKISDIIGVIDEIARQTNLLALNAAVEAARAGEAGRGFAVVATEVRSLAQRSSQAAKDIKDLITNSSSQVKDGVELVNRAGASLNEIVGSIKKVTDIVADIANASMEQSTGIDQINKALTQMDEVTQQNSALVEENAATAKALERQAKSMDEQVAIFRLRSGAEHAGYAQSVTAEDAAAGAAPAHDSAEPAAKSAVPKVAMQKRSSPAVKRSVPGGPVGRMQVALATAVQSDPEWKEF